MRSNTLLCFLLFASLLATAQKEKSHFSYLDVFELEYVTDPQISPDGSKIVYKRNGFDIMNDRSRGNLWLINSDGTGHVKLTADDLNESNPRWSPSGDRIAYTKNAGQGTEIYIYWVKTGKSARISRLEYSPSSLTWSPKGDQLAFTMTLPSKPPISAKIPKKPKGAKWAADSRLTDRLKHEADGRGYVKPGFSQVFVIPAIGGAPRQITDGNFQHRGQLSFHPDGTKIFFSSNRSEEWEYDFRNSEIYSVEIASGKIDQLTERSGPDNNPAVSPDGKYIAYLGYEDKRQAHQVTELQLMRIDGSDKRSLTASLDRSARSITWSKKNDAIYFLYDDKGNTKIGKVDLKGKISELTDNVGGTVIGRPYGGGYFSVSNDDQVAYTMTRPEFPGELAVLKKNSNEKITSNNAPLLDYKKLGKVEEIWYKSSFDGRDLQGWIVYPPEYDPGKKYPMMVENHGGPMANYGDRFSAEMQLYASGGYIVFYPNMRGSTSYGEEFSNLLQNNYPGEDYNDVMDGVDALISKGIAHEDQLFVAGGSAGGLLSAWIIGKNDRFEAAAVVKPVMNWISKTLTADNYYGYANSRYTGQPWENFEEYWKFSPISLVGNVTTPTMVMVGMNDLRTPPSEAKQLYHALKLQKVPTLYVEISEAGHGIARKPSNLIRKVAHTLAWFDQYKKTK